MISSKRLGRSSTTDETSMQNAISTFCFEKEMAMVSRKRRSRVLMRIVETISTISVAVVHARLKLSANPRKTARIMNTEERRIWSKTMLEGDTSATERVSESGKYPPRRRLGL